MMTDTPISNISMLRELGGLAYLRLRGDTNLHDIAPLANLKKLRGLDLTDVPITNITVLGDLEDLWDLSLSGTQISDLTPLRNLRNLETLNVSNTRVSAAQIEDLRDALAPPKGKLPKIFGEGLAEPSAARSPKQ